MEAAGSLERGREAFARKAWGGAYAQLQLAARESALPAEDLERLAMAAHLLGRDDESADLLTRAHNEFLGQGMTERAARAAIWLSFQLQVRGEVAQAGGWVARARRLLDDGRDCVEQGFLLVQAGLRCFHDADPAAALVSFREAAKIGERFDDRDLITMARHGQGRSLIRLGRAAEGLALQDEVMVAITAGEVSPVVAGDLYCSVIEACNEVFDLRRAREWTAALNQWFASQPDLVAHRGICLVHRAEIMRLHGDWSEAMDQATMARDRLSDPPGQPDVGAAYYQLGELHRLCGDFVRAEEAYREAGSNGRKPQPGLAQLRLAQGQVGAASRAIRTAVDEASERRARCRLLPACVEIMLAAGDLAAARAAAGELAEIADAVGAPFLRAASAQATGAVLLAEGDPRAALSALRRAWTEWRGLGAPYEAARTGVLIAVACRELHDTESAEMELDAVRRVFQQLGAVADLARLRELFRKGAPSPPGSLTARELEVLSLVATGRTNRGIARALGISDKTVARHVSNIFTKLGLSSRAAATAYAYQQKLLEPRT